MGNNACAKKIGVTQLEGGQTIKLGGGGGQCMPIAAPGHVEPPLLKMCIRSGKLAGHTNSQLTER